MEYHKTRDILYVMRLLGHKNIKNTLIYMQLVNFESDEYNSAVAENLDEARKQGLNTCAHTTKQCLQKEGVTAKVKSKKT
jgi:hypothetical protein